MLIELLARAAIPFYYRRVKRFLADARRARQIQRDLLLTKVARHAVSDFGREHGFAHIRSVADFRRQVPVAGYDYYQPYIERVKRGDLGAMFGPGTKLLMFALTSGTTSASKFIPVTREFFDEYRRGWFIWGANNYRDHSDQVGRRTLHLTTDWKQFHTEGGIPCGNISGLAAELAPPILHFAYAVPRPVAKISDPEAKHYTILRIALAQPQVGMIITANPSTLVELARRADAQRESLIRDIFDGTLSTDVKVPGPVRESLHPQIGRPDRQRARELERIIQRTGALYPKDFWTRLSLLAVWLGGSVGVYLPLLKPYYGDTMFRDHGLSASEGRMTIPLADGANSGVLEFASHYFEFIPEEEHGTAQPTVLEAHELEVGRNYFILLTTSGGLYRYDIQDVVRCVGYEGEAPVLEFLNKGAHFSSITGEKLSEFQVVAAVKKGFAELGLPLEYFTVAPVMCERPYYVLLLEADAYGDDPERLAERIDFHLTQGNAEYAEKVRSGRLMPLVVRELPPGTWQAFRQQRIAAQGNPEGYKHPCLVGDLQFIDKLRELGPVVGAKTGEAA